MNIGNQIKTLRLKKSVTQEAMAEHFGMTAQAVSKWECGTSVPDISLLPELSAYFGVTIDALFALDDETRMERIQNMLWDVRFLNQADVDSATAFLLEKAAKEPKNGRPHELLADKTPYPLHVGITESGTVTSGNIKSSIGLGIILNQGIGDTIRVSLTGNPVEEIKSAKLILRTLR